MELSVGQTEDKETVLSIYCYMKFFNEDLCMSVPIRLELISNYFPSVRPRVYLLETYGMLTLTIRTSFEI